MNTLYQLNLVLVHLMQLVVFNTKTHSSNEKILLNSNVQNE